MAKSIERRIRNTVLGAVVMTLLVAVVSVLVANDKLEQSILSLDMQAERDFMLELAQDDQPLDWQTATLQGFYLPDTLIGSVALPEIFQAHPFPYAGEVEIGDETFVITSTKTAHGRLYLAKEITIFENQEALFHRFLFALCVVMIIQAIVLARYTSRRLAGPLTRMAQQIGVTEPAPAMARIPAPPADLELQAIARSFNRFLDEIESYVRREKSLLGMASHELRTPIAIIAGALDGIETRDQASPTDRKALGRIRRAADEMGSNVDVILKLTRREQQTPTPVSLTEAIREVLEEATAGQDQRGGQHGRLRFEKPADPIVMADAVLVKMLVRNLLNNALQHTPGIVDVRLDEQWLEIADQGAGLPAHYRQLLVGDTENTFSHSLPGLGLFIVTLVCERLNWRITMEPSADAGLVLRLRFSDMAANAPQAARQAE